MHKRKHLVFLPGWSNDSRSLWHPQLRHLEQIFDISTLVVTDQPSVCGMAREVLRQAPDKFFLLGHSLGGLVAQHVALNSPHRVEGLILVCTFSGKLPELQRAFFRHHILKPLLNDNPKALDLSFSRAFLAPEQACNSTLLQTLTDAQKLSSQGMINQAQALIGARDVTQKLRKIEIPRLIIHGRQDLLSTLPMQEQMIAMLAPCTVARIENCGHMPSIEQPEVLTGILSSWLDMHQSLAEITQLIDRLSLPLMPTAATRQ